MEIDLEAIQRRNNNVLKSADHSLSDDVHFTGQYNDIVLTNNEKRLFNSSYNKQVMLQESRNTLQSYYNDIASKFNQYRSEHATGSTNAQPTFDSDRRKVLALFRDRIAYNYFNHVESLNMDDSSVICSLCQEFVFVRQFYNHVDKEHPDYFYKLEAMNRQLFRNAPPIELNFPRQSEFDIETHTIGQIDHLTIYYSRAEHISINSLLIHDIRPSESRRRLCLVHRMNEMLDNINEREQIRKIQAQAKEDKKLLTQENKKRKKRGQPILLELPNNEQQLIRTYYHHRGRSGLINLTPVQALALKNREYLHKNKQYQPKIRSLIDVPSHDSSQSGTGHLNDKEFKLMNYLQEHNRFIETVSKQNTDCLSYDLNQKNDDRVKHKQARRNARQERRMAKEKIRKRKYFERDSDYDCDAEFELNSFVTKTDIHEAFMRTIQRRELESSPDYYRDVDEHDIENENYYRIPVEHSPAVGLVSSCSHVQNRHLRRPKCDFIPKRIYKAKSHEPVFGYDCWNSVQDRSFQRKSFAISAIEKYFPRFRGSDMFMRSLFDNLEQYSGKSVTFCLKMTVLETILHRKYFISYDVLRDYFKVGYLKKIFKKLNKSEVKYYKYSKNDSRFRKYYISRPKLTSSRENNEALMDSSSLNQFFDNTQLFGENDVFDGKLPFEIIDRESFEVHPVVDAQIAQETNEISLERSESLQVLNVRNDLFDLKGERFVFSELSADSVESCLGSLIKTIFKKAPASIEDYPLNYRSLANLDFNEQDFKNFYLSYLSLGKKLENYLGLHLEVDQKEITSQAPEERPISLSEVSQKPEVYDISNIPLSDRDLLDSHSDYIDKILHLLQIEAEDNYENRNDHMMEEGSNGLLLTNEGSIARFISPSYNANICNVKMAESDDLNACRKIYILKNCNRVTRLTPLSPSQIKQGTIILLPSNDPKQIPDTIITRKLNKTDCDVPLAKAFKGPDRSNPNRSLHKYFTRYSDMSRKRPLDELESSVSLSPSVSPLPSSSSEASASSASPCPSLMPSVSETSAKKSRANADCDQVDSEPYPTDSEDSFNQDKSSLREVLPGRATTRPNSSNSSSLPDSDDTESPLVVNQDASSSIYID